MVKLVMVKRISVFSPRGWHNPVASIPPVLRYICNAYINKLGENQIIIKGLRYAR